MSFRLVVISGSEYVFHLASAECPTLDYSLREGQTLTIGRGGSADIRLFGSGAEQGVVVARRQADLGLNHGVVRILDYGCSRGEVFRQAVAVNDQYLEGNGTQWLPLTDGDTIRVGDTSFRLERSDDEH